MASHSFVVVVVVSSLLLLLFSYLVKEVDCGYESVNGVTGDCKLKIPDALKSNGGHGQPSQYCIS